MSVREMSSSASLGEELYHTTCAALLMVKSFLPAYKEMSYLEAPYQQWKQGRSWRNSNESPREVMIIGGGLGGLNTAIELAKWVEARGKNRSGEYCARITLVDTNDRFAFIPLLYELVAEPLRLAASVRSNELMASVSTSAASHIERSATEHGAHPSSAKLLSRKFTDHSTEIISNATASAAATAMESFLLPTYTNLLDGFSSTRFLRGEVKSTDLDAKTVIFHPNHQSSHLVEELSFDQIVFATGSRTNRVMWPGADKFSLPFRTQKDAIHLRNHLEKVIHTRTAPHIAIIGTGFCGVELAASIASVLNSVQGSITLYARGNTILRELPVKVQMDMTNKLKKMGVTIEYEVTILEITESGFIQLDKSDGQELIVMADAVILTAGCEQTPLVQSSTIPSSKRGIQVKATLEAIEHDFVFALGDCAVNANQLNSGDQYWTPTAQCATQQSAIVAHNLMSQWDNHTDSKGGRSRRWSLVEFKYHHLGDMVVMGPWDTEFVLLGGRLTFSGKFAALLRRIVYSLRMPTYHQRFTALSVVVAMVFSSIFTCSKK